MIKLLWLQTFLALQELQEKLNWVVWDVQQQITISALIDSKQKGQKSFGK